METLKLKYVYDVCIGDFFPQIIASYLGISICLINVSNVEAINHLITLPEFLFKGNSNQNKPIMLVRGNDHFEYLQFFNGFSTSWQWKEERNGWIRISLDGPPRFALLEPSSKIYLVKLFRKLDQILRRIDRFIQILEGNFDGHNQDEHHAQLLKNQDIQAAYLEGGA